MFLESVLFFKRFTDVFECCSMQRKHDSLLVHRTLSVLDQVLNFCLCSKITRRAITVFQVRTSEQRTESKIMKAVHYCFESYHLFVLSF